MQGQHKPESAKKTYEAPVITDYETLEEQTAAGNANPTGDGITGSS